MERFIDTLLLAAAIACGILAAKFAWLFFALLIRMVFA
jgi:hypothetical protein